jgi:hypothetical protein
MWATLKQLFGAPTVSARYADFKQVLATKLSGHNPIPEIERLTNLFRQLSNLPLQLSETLQAMILLTALPSKWDSIAQLFFQYANLAASLMFSNIRKTIAQEEYECHGWPADQSTNKLSTVKCKGPDPAHHH